MNENKTGIIQNQTKNKMTMAFQTSENHYQEVKRVNISKIKQNESKRK